MSPPPGFLKFLQLGGPARGNFATWMAGACGDEQAAGSARAIACCFRRPRRKCFAINGERLLGKRSSARAPKTTRGGACAPQSRSALHAPNLSTSLLDAELSKRPQLGRGPGKQESLRVFASSRDAPVPDSLEQLGNGLMVAREGAKTRRNEG